MSKNEAKIYRARNFQNYYQELQLKIIHNLK